MTLAALLQGIATAPALAMSDLTLDSRAVATGGVFLALSGTARHGIEFADQACDRGAVAIITDLPQSDPRVSALGLSIPVISVPADTALASTLAVRFFADPTAHLDTVAVTGTNGKTSICWLVSNALERLGRAAAFMGTLGHGQPSALQPQSLTTPDAVSLQRYAYQLLQQNFSALVFEASSHAISQGRLAATSVDVAVFSNLTRDHLDYHGEMEAYFEAKAALFALPQIGVRICAIDDHYGRILWQRFADSAWAVTTESLASIPTAARTPGCVAVKQFVQTPTGLQVTLQRIEGEYEISSCLYGDFNVQNIALAFAALCAVGVAPDAAAASLAEVAPPPGRMQRVVDAQPAVYVDYCHTPAALHAALSTLRAHTDGHLWCVFGCGGERDRGKRPLMARAAQSADRVVVTSDNPRSEDPDRIIDDVVAGLDTAPIWCDPDRAAAIHYAISHAQRDDVVLIAGKGHERVQWIDGDCVPFDDVQVAETALHQRGVA